MTLIYLLIELVDELVFGVEQTAWPLIRNDLRLSYAEIGLLLSVPAMAAAFIEPFLGVLGDVWKRRLLILGGGLTFAVSLALTAASHSFLPLLISLVLFYPSSGAFVSLSQATLMDSAPERHEQNMARWTFAGSLGNLSGPLLLGLFVALGLGWRGTYAFLAGLSAFCLLAAYRFIPSDRDDLPAIPSFGSLWNGLRSAFSALRRAEVWRWLLLLEFGDLMQDILLGYLALYFVDVAGATEAGAGTAVLVWVAMGLLTDLLFIPFIDRQPDSARFLRTTASLQVLAFSIFMILPGYLPKLAAVVLVNLLNTGWYSVLQGRLYSELPGQSASIMAIGSVTAPLAKLFPFLIGLLADRYGLGPAMWLLILGPLALIIGLPRRDRPEAAAT
jgi:FSR family fosmidomycin resistance protein-like MFS transporter